MVFGAVCPAVGRRDPIGCSITVTTAYANGNPVSNQIDTSVFSESDTGYIQIVNTGETTFSGVVGTAPPSP
jgi:hypothetical protein